MASWQAILLNQMLRFTLKRRADRPFDLDLVRKLTRSPPKRALHVPVGWTVKEIEPEPGLRFDVADRATTRTAEPSLIVMYLHGGGYFFGSPKTHRQVVIGLARSLAAPVHALTYRLAPEHPFPAATEDALAAYAWLIATYPSANLVLAGDSAGGGLALVTAIAARDRGWRMPAAIIAFSPWTDLAATGASLETNNKSCAMFTANSIRKGAAVYLGTTSRTDPRASPLYADLTGLPPMLVFASRHEVLLDDSVRLAQKARAAGVEVTLIVRDRMPHVWPIFHRLLPEGREALAQSAAFVTGLLDKQPAPARHSAPLTPA